MTQQEPAGPSWRKTLGSRKCAELRPSTGLPAYLFHVMPASVEKARDWACVPWCTEPSLKALVRWPPRPDVPQCRIPMYCRGPPRCCLKRRLLPRRRRWQPGVRSSAEDQLRWHVPRTCCPRRCRRGCFGRRGGRHPGATRVRWGRSARCSWLCSEVSAGSWGLFLPRGRQGALLFQSSEFFREVWGAESERDDIRFIAWRNWGAVHSRSFGRLGAS